MIEKERMKRLKLDLKKRKKDIKLNDNHLKRNMYVSISMGVSSLIWLSLFYFWLKHIPGSEFLFRTGEFLSSVVPSAFLTSAFYFFIYWLTEYKEEKRIIRIVAEVKNAGTYSINKIIEKTREYLGLYLMYEEYGHNLEKKYLEFARKRISVKKVARLLQKSVSNPEKIKHRNSVCDELCNEIDFFISQNKLPSGHSVLNILYQIQKNTDRLSPSYSRKNDVILTGHIYTLVLLEKLLSKRIDYMSSYFIEIPAYEILLENND